MQIPIHLLFRSEPEIHQVLFDHKSDLKCISPCPSCTVSQVQSIHQMFYMQRVLLVLKIDYERYEYSTSWIYYHKTEHLQL